MFRLQAARGTSARKPATSWCTEDICPVAFDSLVTGRDSAVKFGPFMQGDLPDRDALDAAFVQYDPRRRLKTGSCFCKRD